MHCIFECIVNIPFGDFEDAGWIGTLRNGSLAISQAMESVDKMQGLEEKLL